LPPRRRIVDPKRGAAPEGGFTLIELLVVVGILAALVALLLPAVQAARESARRAQCGNHLHQLGVGAQLFHDRHKHFPGSWVGGDERVSWGLGLLPFIEQQSLADQWAAALQWWEDPNAALVAWPIAIYKCPTSPSPDVYEYDEAGRPSLYASLDYKGCQGANASDASIAHWNLTGWLWGVVCRKYVAAREITDGLSSTVLLVESVGGKEIFGPGGGPFAPSEIWYPTDGAWVGRALSSVSPAQYAKMQKLGRCSVNCTNKYDYGPYSFHPGVAMSVNCDSSVRTLAETIDDAVLCGLYCYNEGQLIGQY
jgi:prepilin-type N-terminal cleavage/methylation domain-containing protein